MQVRRLTIDNFRGIKHAELYLPQHAVLIGDNNTGKTTVLEALDLVLGPERLSRFPPVDEHDFFEGRYIEEPGEDGDLEEDVDEEVEEAEPTDTQNVDEEVNSADDGPYEFAIHIEAVIIGLSDEQTARFGDHIEWWDASSDELYEKPNPEGVDGEHITAALRITFIGKYDPDEDDFEGNTYFTRSISEDDEPSRFSRRDKQFCGFLYLRSLRTGRRALSLERGSLLDIILRLKEIRPQMWEATLGQLSSFTVASEEEHGISGVLESINQALKKYVPREWGAQPHLHVSNLTRDHLRSVITAFIATGEGKHAAPYYRQGTGTVNMLVLAMLSQIAKDKQNVMFAMEEPEIAIPPYAQKRIVHEVRALASQAIFTSHSPYVLEEFTIEETVVMRRDESGAMEQAEVKLPESVKLKRYRHEFRTRFCEGLLASRILLAEGATEAASLPSAARRLAELNPDNYSSLEALGICTLDAGGEGNLVDLAKMYSALGKRVFAACDKQDDEDEKEIEAEVEALFMHEENSIEKLVLKESSEAALERFADSLDWPAHITDKVDPKAEPKKALRKYFAWSKGNWGVADFLVQCVENEMPKWITDTCRSLKEECEDAPVSEDTDAADVEDGSGDDEKE